MVGGAGGGAAAAAAAPAAPAPGGAAAAAAVLEKVGLDDYRMLVCDQIPDGPKQDEIQDTIRGAQAKEAIHDAVMRLKREQILALVQALAVPLTEYETARLTKTSLLNTLADKRLE